MFPETVKKAFAMMVEIHGRDEWEPGASRRVEPTEENLKIIFAEKDQAEKEAKALASILQVDSLGLPDEFAEEIKTLLELYVLYVRGFKYSAHACFLTRKASQTQRQEDKEAAMEAMGSLKSYRAEILERLKGTHYPHYVYWLFDESRLDQLTADVKTILDGIKQ